MGNAVKALEGVTTTDEIRVAFETEHPLVSSSVRVSPDGNNRAIEVEGSYFDRETKRSAGRFVRKIEFINGRFWIFHAVFELDAPYRRKGIAWEHYSRALTFYHVVLRAARVYMKADFQGPYVWGDLGFEFEPADWHMMLNALDDLHQAAYGAPPRFYPETASGLALTAGEDGARIGEEAIRAVHESSDGGLRMFLRFDDARTIQSLLEDGILWA